MTAFGKLLVLLNLAFSVATGALIVFVFTTRADWSARYKELDQRTKAAEAALKAVEASRDAERKQKDATIQSQSAQMASLQTQVEAARKDANDARQSAANQEARKTADQTAIASLQAELQQIKAEREILVKAEGDLRKRIVDILKERDTFHETAITMELRARDLQKKNERLLQQIEDLTVKVTELENSGVGRIARGESSVDGAGSILNPPSKAPPPGVKGKVTEVGKAATGLVQINIGSDSGLSVGNVLTVFNGSDYKGDLRLVTVNPKVAVGKFTPAKRNMTIQANDSVITSFSGGSQ